MGEGGTFVLINGTPYAWVKTGTSSYQMNAWSFPDVVGAGQTTSVYVEWDENILHNKGDDSGEVHFSLQGTPHTFQLQARGSGGFHLQVYLDGIATANNPQGSTVRLGWHHDGNTVFILSGQVGRFSSVNPPSNWMQTNISSLGSRPIRHLCIPGSHDSGMSIINGKTVFANPDNVLTQTVPIAQQLSLGARYFDLRPVVSDGQFKCGHYSKVDVVGWQGANGESFSQVIDEINTFTNNNKELVVLNLSHDRNTDDGRDYRALNQDEWNRLFAQLSGIHDLFVAPDPTAVDLVNLPLNQFIGQNRAAVVIIIQPDDQYISLGDYATRGFYFYRQFNAYNSYSDSNDLSRMTQDQLDKMRAVRPNPNGQLFLLSWTLTQDAGDIVGGTSILDLAREANPAMFTALPPACNANTFPNILYIDNFAESNVTALAMAINDMAQP